MVIIGRYSLLVVKHSAKVNGSAYEKNTAQPANVSRPGLTLQYYE
jgi:hypothetical protein